MSLTPHDLLNGGSKSLCEACGPIKNPTAPTDRLFIHNDFISRDGGYNGTILNLFGNIVAETPEAEAVRFGACSYTYSELDVVSNRLAHYLRTKGVKQDTMVPICMNRSLELIIGILGVLKAGGAYVPVDPQTPIKQVQRIIQETNAALVFAHNFTYKEIATTNGAAEIIVWEDIEPLLNSEPDSCPFVDLHPEHLAYVIFTSGSTGKPKGVLIEHAQLFNATRARVAYYKNLSNTLLITSVSFDASLATIFGSLCSGGCIIVCRQEDLQDPQRLEELIPQLDTILCVPSYYRFLLDHDFLQYAKVSKVILGGETLSHSLVSSHFEKNGGAALFNEYGPTETTIWATVDQIKSADSLVTIGLPIEGVEAYIVGDGGSLLEENAVGELYLGGKGVARGYLNDPDNTLEHFIKNPFATSHARLYKTGDLCYKLPDGRIVFVGRTDDQVKINGHRIEMGQIESVLQQITGVRQAAVIAKESRRGTKYLVAFVQQSGALNKDFLKAQLQASLPYYMIPNLWVQLNDFPLTRNGKVDRQALYSHEITDQTQPSETGVMDSTEGRLVSLWQHYLPVRNITIDDDFLELGGNSLMAMSLVAAIRREFNFDLSVSAFFQRPTIAKLAQWIKSMPEGNMQNTDALVDTNAPLEGLPVLSFGQESLWLIAQLGESGAYHLPIALRVEGDLNQEALTWSVRNLLLRHEPLRTTIRGEEDEKHPYLLRSEDWHFMPTDNGMYPDNIEEMIKQPFSLSDDFMIRGWLLSVGPKESTLLFVIHHIAFDAWSKQLFLDELWAGYYAFITKSPLTLPPLPINYATYALRQRSATDQIVPKLAYWKNKLQDFSPLQLPRDGFPKQQEIEGAKKNFTVSPSLLAAVRYLSKKQGVTEFMTLLAVFKVLLHRYSSQEDILVGTAIAGREQMGTEALIGYFVNSLPLRTEVEGMATFLDVLNRVKQTTLEAYDAKEVPFERIVGEIGVERQAGQNPLFQVMFNFQDIPQPNLKQNDDLTLSILEVPQTTSKFDLTFSLSVAGEGIVGEVEYRTGTYYPSTIERMIQHYLLLLETATQQPLESVGKLNMINKQEQQLLLAFNQTSRPYPQGETILDLLERQVNKSPDKTAIIFGDRSISYGVLDAKSNQLAHLLREKGAREESLVLLCMNRSLEMIIALLGILKSGAAYVPIDPAYPQQRKTIIQEDTGAQLAVTDPENQKELSGIHRSKMIILEPEAANLSHLPQEKVECAVQLGHLAYVIYTSGSTGRPKGVMIEHRNVYSFISWCREEFSSSTCDVVYAATSICFDLSVFEIFYSLSAGIKIRLLQDGLEIKRHLSQDARIMVNTVPSVVRHLLDEEADLSNVSVLNMAGEPLATKILEQLDVERIEVRNLYGPTEDTTYSTIYRVGSDRETLIGKPISNTYVHIINQQNSLNPVGVPGEICLSGSGLARGYLGRPDLTGEKFLANPFADTAGDRMYKTGDIGRWLPNGQIQYIGRKDDQVKIRGYRIELGEIEKVLQQYPQVTQAIVLAKSDQKESHHLVGYVVMDGLLDKKSLMYFLKQRLPAYMVPALWVQLDAFPLTPNGKINKKILPHPLQDDLIDPTRVAPRNDVEKALAELWKELLQTKEIGIHDDFFVLGGTSLLAMRFIAAVRKLYKIDFALQDLFRYPTIAGLAGSFDLQKTSSDPSAIQSHRPRPEVLPLSFNQESLWFIDQLGGSHHYHIPLVLKLDGILDLQALERSLRQVIERHEVLRTVIQHNEGLPHQVVNNVSDWQIERIYEQNHGNDPRAIQELLDEIIDPSFDLSKDYMLRASLISLGRTHHILVLVVHHIAFDGWSTSLLLDELAISYRSFQKGRTPSLPTLSLQYVDYAIWQKQLLQGDVLKQETEYWKKKLLNVGMLQLPVDFPRRSISNFKGAVETIHLDERLREQLSQLSQHQSVTLFMTLLTAFKMLLSHYSKQRDICVGTVTTGRHHEELEKLIGHFAQTLPIRTSLSPTARFIDVLTDVKTNVLEAFENQQLPFERIVAETQATRNLHENPLFQVFFVFQSFPEIEPISLGEVTMVLQPVDQKTSKFDLSFIVSEAGSGLKLTVEYNINLFQQATIKQMRSDYIHLLNGVVTDPNLIIKKYLQDDLAQVWQAKQMDLTEVPKEGHDIDGFAQPSIVASQKIIADIWANALGKPAIGITDNFFEVGGESLVAVQVMSQLEKKIGTKLPLSILFKHPTVKEMAQAIEQEQSTKRSWKSLVPIKASGTKPPLYMIHGGGSNILPFYSIAKNMDPEQPVYGLQPKGLDGKEPPLRTVEAIASHFISEILQHEPSGPIRLAGYSFGGMIAFEMAQQLTSMGREVSHLVMFDTIAYQSDHRENSYIRLKNRIKRSIGKRIFDLYLLAKFPRTFLKIKRESLSQKVKRLCLWAGLEERQPPTDLMQIITSIEASHREASKKYILKPYERNVYLMKAKIPTHYHGYGEFLGWKKYVKHIHVEEMEGEHTTMFSPPQDVKFAASLQRILDTNWSGF